MKSLQPVLRYLALPVIAATGVLSTLHAAEPSSAVAPAPAVTATPASGTAASVTFTHDIAPIVFNQCMTCHRPGEVGPFPLTTYAEVKRKSKTILDVIDDSYMPPWHAASHGQFLNERKLTAEQKAAFHAWVAAGAPEGNPAELPPQPHFTEGWQTGEPDLVLEPSESYTLAAEGRDVYRCFVIPTGLTEDRYVQTVEVRPGNRSVVHHVIIYIDTSGEGRRLDAADPGPGYTSFGGVGFTPAGGLSGWVPGISPTALPSGVGYFLPKNADLVVQVHYHKDGKEETDRTRVGLFFNKQPVDKRYRSFPVAYRRLHIPAGADHYTAEANLPIPGNVTVLSVIPHMHWLGRDMVVTATLPDGTDQELVNVPDWDFNWQTSYWFKEPLKLPRGSSLHLQASYDNSAKNPHNPNSPPKDVTWGEQTTNEMCLAFVGYTVDAEHLTQGKAITTPREAAARRAAAAAAANDAEAEPGK